MTTLRKGLGAAAALVWLGGCASILDVSASDYIDAADVLCRCTKQQDACKGVVEGAIEDNAELEGVALDCLAEAGDTCTELYRCVGKSYCSEARGQCGFDDQDKAIIGCCEGTTCEKGQCCKAAGTACSTGRDCCAGNACTASVCTPAACSDIAARCTTGAECCSGTCRAVGDARVCSLK